MTQIHGTCILIEGIGVVLRGPPGCGKSDLALRLIDGGARLVADDRVDLDLKEDWVCATPPSTLAGRMEIRGIGIVEIRHVHEAPVGLIVDLVPSDEVERLPNPASAEILGHILPLVRLNPFEASAPAKVRVAARVVDGAAGLVQ
ncbi:MAG: HPr kinase/phosphatase C-terminal domain-containing protein [Rhodospirillales bacterium]|nr:HPr kinase/phosphatase C-terminal domain-containing protein [Rhodospirillales bacterium]MCW8862187.1 HPr kinase/phosphatase C-terminal domain-containing protein [Rhodospirillales bacterium]MCW8953232.1 HPr kinase/phosphatase C-terminal domain-containing protein [Rhodospirillales bacterium]MCW8970541.1 HPr kinase/phosphatase C-terminal domain-containing protein [Rhodospirillales bacterium]MCW9002749.1 HPr kinase/phosphatase C-terminal domain-containing protein [Rhodospirillales bacterium]